MPISTQQITGKETPTCGSCTKKRFGWQVLIDCDHMNFRTGIQVTDRPVSDIDIKRVIQDFQRMHPFVTKPSVQAIAFLGVSYYEGAYFESLDIEKFWTENYYEQLKTFYRAKEGENIG